VAPLGLELIADEVRKGYAYLRQRGRLGESSELPRLVPRRPLGFQVSLLLVLLRKKLAESDAQGDGTRIIFEPRTDRRLCTGLPFPTRQRSSPDGSLDTHLNKVSRWDSFAG